MRIKFPHYFQHDTMDCGPACVRMIAKYYGKSYSLQYLREHCFLTREGVSLLGISDAAERIGLKTVGAKITFEQLSKVKLPCIQIIVPSDETPTLSIPLVKAIENAKENSVEILSSEKNVLESRQKVDSEVFPI